ncbi:MAG: DUF2804 domain-containing protein [Bacilli bacterium]
MQKEITQKGPLLNEDGSLVEAGYAKSLIKDYDRKKIKAKKSRIKEWDYYLIYNADFAIALTIDDNSYMGMTSVSLLDFKTVKEHTNSLITFFTNGKTMLPASSKEGDLLVENKNIRISFNHIYNGRKLFLYMPSYLNGKPLEINVTLTDEPQESIVVMTPFKEKKTAFYYNQKIVGFKADGYILFDGKKTEFDEKDTRALLDWGRGVWTYKNTWYWSSGCFRAKNHEIGFNLGYGFGDLTNASENMVIVDGVVHKLDRVSFNIPQNEKGKDEFLKDWSFTSNDEKINLTFHPILDRHSDTNILILRSLQHQVFGYFSGYFILETGEKITFEKKMAFAEKVYNKW